MPKFARAAVLVFLAGATVTLTTLAHADSEIAGRLERDAQQASNNGRYQEARQLRDIAQVLRQHDSVMSRRIQTEVGAQHFDKAKEMLRMR